MVCIKLLKIIPKHTLKITDADNPSFIHVIPAPRYKVGEVVYIKEAYGRWGHWNKNKFVAVSNTMAGIRYLDNRPPFLETDRTQTGWFKRSPLFMPEWAARDFIKFTKIKAERLQDIGFRDCEAEGIYIYVDPWKAKGLSVSQVRMRFARLWNSINAKRGYSWESNPWVFAYTFERALIKGGEEDGS